MNQLIPIIESSGSDDYGNNDILVSGRDLHEFLVINTRYIDWFKRMLDYGFVEGVDYVTVTQKRVTAQGNKTTYTDHHLKLDTAKEISMIQRNEKGKQARQYFIEVEKKWNSPEMIIQRAMQIQQRKIEQLEAEREELLPKATYHDIVLQSKSLVSTTQIAKDFGMGAPTLNKILHDLGIQYKKGHRWYLYYEYQDKGYAQSKTWAINADETKDHMYWTQKGRLFIYETLKNKKGILPIVEREQGQVAQ